MAAPKDIRAMQALLARGLKAREEYDKKWTENLKWIKGEQAVGMQGTRADTITNFLFSQLMTVIPILANRVPEISLKPIAKGPEGDAIAEMISGLINRTLRRNDFIKKQQELVTNGLSFGHAYFKPVWNQKLRHGLGDFQIDVPDTRHVVKEPGKMTVAGSNWIMEVRPVDKLTLYRLYPNKRNVIDQIFRSGETADTFELEEGINTGEIGYHAAGPEEGSPRTTSEAYVFDTAMRSKTDKPFVNLVESWFLDETMVDEAAVIEGVSDTEVRRTPKYPNGRLIVWSGDQKLDDRPNPFPHFPYLEYENYHIPGEPYGMSEVEQIKPLQEQFNTRMNQLMDAMNFANHKMLFFDQSSGLDPDEITNEPGGMYPIADVNGIKVIDYGGPNRAQFDSLTLYQRLIEIVSGVREVTQGEVPGDVRSGFAVEQLQEAAQTRLRMKTRIIEDAVGNLAKVLTDMIGLFYIPGVHYGSEMDLKGVTHTLFDYEIRAGINLPQSRLAEQQLIQWAFANRIVDQKYVVETFDFPNKEEVIERMTPTWDALNNPQPETPEGGGGNVTPIGGAQ